MYAANAAFDLVVIDLLTPVWSVGQLLSFEQGRKPTVSLRTVTYRQHVCVALARKASKGWLSGGRQSPPAARRDRQATDDLFF